MCYITFLLYIHIYSNSGRNVFTCIPAEEEIFEAMGLKMYATHSYSQTNAEEMAEPMDIKMYAIQPYIQTTQDEIAAAIETKISESS